MRVLKSPQSKFSESLSVVYCEHLVSRYRKGFALASGSRGWSGGGPASSGRGPGVTGPGETFQGNGTVVRSQHWGVQTGHCRLHRNQRPGRGLAKRGPFADYHPRHPSRAEPMTRTAAGAGSTTITAEPPEPQAGLIFSRDRVAGGEVGAWRSAQNLGEQGRVLRRKVEAVAEAQPHDILSGQTHRRRRTRVNAEGVIAPNMHRLGLGADGTSGEDNHALQRVPFPDEPTDVTGCDPNVLGEVVSLRMDVKK